MVGMGLRWMKLSTFYMDLNYPYQHKKLRVKVVFNHDKVITPPDVFEVLKTTDIKFPDDLECVQALNAKNTFDIKFASFAARDKCVKSLREINNITVSLYDPSVWVTILYIDCDEHQTLVERTLSRYGKVKESRDCHYIGLPTLKNGNRQFKMILEHNIPSFITIGARRAHVRYRGQPRTCFRCGQTGHEAKSCENVRCYRCLEVGHERKDCTSDIVCTICGLQGHVYRACPTSFANKLTSPPTNDSTDDEYFSEDADSKNPSHEDITDATPDEIAETEKVEQAHTALPDDKLPQAQQIPPVNPERLKITMSPHHATLLPQMLTPSSKKNQQAQIQQYSQSNRALPHPWTQLLLILQLQTPQLVILPKQRLQQIS